MAQSAKIVFFGNERLATGVTTEAPTLQGLTEHGYNIAALVTNAKPAQSRKTRELEIELVAARHDIFVLSPARPRDIIEDLQAMQPDIGVLVAYGRIVPQDIIDVFPHGIINIHPSLLPLHRGPTPIEQVILEGATETGVSIMQLTSHMDAGPVYAQERVHLTGNETKQDLATQLLHTGSNMVIDCLPRILANALEPTPQDDAHATYDQLIAKSDGRIDWHKPAVQIEREIRAYLGWPGSQAVIDGTDVTITSAHTTSTAAGMPPVGHAYHDADGGIAISTGAGLIIVDTLKPAGKREMTSREFLAGHPLPRTA